jgi:hypothetical protein
MMGVAVEQMLELWCVELRQVKAHLQSLFVHSSVAASAAAFLDGLLGPERRKTGWMRAEAAGDPGPWRQQAVLGRSHWDADALRDMVRDYALETLASPGAVLVIDETGFFKQGVRSCGVGRQYTGSAGKITNCQIGVFAAYVSDKGCAFIDRQLYLPQDWINKPERRTAAQVPDSIRFGLAPLLIRLANSSRWGGSHHELGECGLTRARKWCASEPSTKPNKIHGGRRQHVLQVSFGKSDVARAPQVQSPDPGRDRSLDPSALLIVLLEGRLCLALACGFQCLVLLLRTQRQKAPAAPGPM